MSHIFISYSRKDLDFIQRIVAEVERWLESARAVQSAVEAGLKRAARLRQSVLKAAFKGQL
jgi:type I restriction enzyme, S subunit